MKILRYEIISGTVNAADMEVSLYYSADSAKAALMKMAKEAVASALENQPEKTAEIAKILDGLRVPEDYRMDQEGLNIWDSGFTVFFPDSGVTEQYAEIVCMEIELSDCEVEQVYREQERQYLRQDAKRHLETYVLGAELDAVEEDKVKKKLHAFVEATGRSLKEAANPDSKQYILEDIVDKYMSAKDWNIPESDIWEWAIESVLVDLKRKTNMANAFEWFAMLEDNGVYGEAPACVVVTNDAAEARDVLRVGKVDGYGIGWTRLIPLQEAKELWPDGCAIPGTFDWTRDTEDHSLHFGHWDELPMLLVKGRKILRLKPAVQV